MDPRPITSRDRWRYRLDNAFSRGAAPLIVWLAVVTFLLILVAGAILAIAGISANGQRGFIEGTWASLMRTLDPGTMGGDAGWPFRIVALLVTIGGIFIVSTLIGLIANGISQKLDDLRKGRSLVIEQGHTLILGWSPKLMTIISELMIANENQPNSVIVVMSSTDKVEMEDAIRDRVTANPHTKVVCRTGDVSDPQDLLIVNPVGAKAVIILNPEAEGADAEVIRSVLALMQHDRDLVNMHVVAELTDERNARALGMATEGRVATIVSSDIIARITAQVCRQSGLSAVYQELLDFDGDEIYFASEPRVVGMRFSEALLAFESSSLMGIKFADGRIELNPPMDTVLKEGDSVIAIAEDDDKVIFTGLPEVSGDGATAPEIIDTAPVEHLLIAGWNHLGPRLLHQLDQYVGAGSSVHIVYDPDHVDPDDLVFHDVEMLAITTDTADTSQHEPLEALLSSRTFDHVIVLCYRKDLSIAESDARTLMTLLQLRHLLQARDMNMSIVTELLDVKDVELARVANPDDFVVSEQLVSLLMTQLSENPDLGSVFADLFDSYESEIMLKPIDAYVEPGRSVPFHAAVAAARRYHEIAIGYRKAQDHGSVPDSIVVNPNKNEEVAFAPGDQLIVVTTS